MMDIIFLCSRKKWHHFEPVANLLTGRYARVDNFHLDAVVAHSPAVVVTLDDFLFPNAHLNAQLKNQGIGTLMMFDGILEWKRVFDCPAQADEFSFTIPVGVDKVACIGPAQARLLNAWGYGGKCEVVGVPRFDSLIKNPPPFEQRESKTILVTTAKTPGFNRAQMDACVTGLRDIQKAIEGIENVEISWRLPDKITALCDLPSRVLDTRGESLHEAIANADAVVSTMSTVLLEAMASRRPTAALDYTNVPAFVQTAWRITSPQHVEPVIQNLLSPPADRLAYQDVCLRDALFIDEPGAQRLARLIEKMVEIVRTPQAGRSALFPNSILGSTPDQIQVSMKVHFQAGPKADEKSQGPSWRDYNAAVNTAAYWERRYRDFLARLDRVFAYRFLKMCFGRFFRKKKSVFHPSR